MMLPLDPKIVGEAIERAKRKDQPHSLITIINQALISDKPITEALARLQNRGNLFTTQRKAENGQ